MKLIRELLSENITSVIEESANGKKDLYISGIFMQTEAKNKNGRVYPKSMMESKVNEYLQEFVKTNRAMGELEHPAGPQINLDRVSHLITDLHFEGNDIYGKAKVLDTPCGNIARGLIEGGAQLGVSSRGVGSVTSRGNVNEVQNDFRLVTVDLVGNPSAAHALIQGIYENSNWVFENGVWLESELINAKQLIDRKYSEQLAIDLFSKLMTNLKTK